MPLDPDELRTPPAPSDTPADPQPDPRPPSRLDAAGHALGGAGLPAGVPLIDRLDDRAATHDAALAASARGPHAPEPAAAFAPLGAPRDSGVLEPEAGVRQEWMKAVSDHVLALLDAIPERPAQGSNGEAGHALAERASLPIPERPLEGGMATALEHVGLAMDAALETAGPGYLAYVPGGGLYAAALADLISGVGNRFTGYAMAAPGWVRLEQDVLAWLAKEFGYGPDARGLLTTGSSMANFTALVTARHHHFGDTGDYSRALVYTSTQSHHSIAKAVSMAGVPRANLRVCPVDSRFRLDVGALRRQVEADRHRGLQPFCVIAASGTTNTGAIDPLPELAQLCADEDLWLHIDGAYGGAFVLCEAGRARLAGIEGADSLCFDPHKGMFLPYGTGCLLVREGKRLAAAHVGEAAYLRDFDSTQLPSPADLGPELSRAYRGLRLWLPLMVHGAQAFREALHEKLALAQLCAEALDARIEAGAPLLIVARPQLSTVVFRLRREAGESLEDLDARNNRLLAGINARGRAYLSSTLLPLPRRDEAGEDSEGQVVSLRVCVLSFRTHRARIEALMEDLDAALAEL